MLLASLVMIIAIAALVKSADLFVDGASGTAKYLGMSDFLIGMIIVGFGTSAPELLVSANASLGGQGDLSLGNAYGSNIANIALILGLTAVISPVAVQRKIISSEMVRLLLATLVSIYLLWDHQISRYDAAVMLLLFAIFMIMSAVKSYRDSRKEAGAPGSEALDTASAESDGAKDEEGSKPQSIGRELIKLFTGLAILVISSKALVWGAVEIATALGISSLIIGLTVVAVGTSLPELASSLAASIKGRNDMVIGNIVGSNMFNTLAVVGLAGAIREFSAGDAILIRDVSVMTTLTVLLILFSLPRKNAPAGSICRWKGVTLCGIYVLYTAYLIWDAMGAAGAH